MNLFKKKYLLGLVFIILAGFGFIPNQLNGQSGSSCFDYQPGRTIEIRGVAACVCGSGNTCYCAWEVPCDPFE